MSGMLHQGYEACSQHVPSLCPSAPVSCADTRVAQGRQEMGQSRPSYPASMPRCFPVSGAASAPRTHRWSTSKDSRRSLSTPAPKDKFQPQLLLSCLVLCCRGRGSLGSCVAWIYVAQQAPWRCWRSGSPT